MTDLSIVDPKHNDVYPFISATHGLKDAAKGRTVLITGGGSGIGKAIAEAFAQASASKIILVGRTLEKVKKVKADLDTKFTTCNVLAESADVSDENDIEQLFERLKAQGIEVDVLVNNAGVSAYHGLIKDCEVKNWWKNYVIMLKGPIIVTRAFLRARTKTDHGAVIMTSSIGSTSTGPFFSSYASVKSALNRLTEWVDLEGKEQGVQAVAFHPGGVADTDITSKSPEFMRQYYTETAELGAGTCLFLSTPQAAWLSGRYVDSRWDMQELIQHRPKIENENLLKMAVLGVERMKPSH